MKLVAILLMLITGYSPIACAQVIFSEKPESGPVKLANPKAQLKLTTSIIEQNHQCADFVGFKLRFTFENVGNIPIILDKRSFILRDMVSRDLKAAEAKQYETIGNLIYSSLSAGTPVDISNFIILKPTEAYSFDDGIGSFSISDNVSPPKGYLNSGTHYLQVEVATWSYYTDYKLFQQKWKDKGFLWADGLISQPMQFTVDKDRQLKECRQ